jgi:hypothetical protein
VGSVVYSWGVGIKMTLLLAAPAMGIILLQVLPLRRALNAASLMAQVQVISNLGKSFEAALTPVVGCHCGSVSAGQRMGLSRTCL